MQIKNLSEKFVTYADVAYDPDVSHCHVLEVDVSFVVIKVVVEK